MANTVAVSMSMVFSGGGASLQRNSGNNSFSLTDNATLWNVQEIGTSDEILDQGGVTGIGYTMLHNLDQTNFVEFGGVPTSYPIKLKPNQWALCPAGVSAWHGKANSSPVKVEYGIVSL